MYAELKRKKCRICEATKELSKFPKLKKNGKLYPRPFCIECKSQGNFEWDLWKNYRIRKPDYDRMYENQKGCCACCGIHESAFKRKLHVDHDKKTGLVRGLLCTQCNPGIGYFEHSVGRLKKAVRYLEKFKK